MRRNCRITALLVSMGIVWLPLTASAGARVRHKPHAAYSYHATAYDAAGGVSSASNTVSVMATSATTGSAPTSAASPTPIPAATTTSTVGPSGESMPVGDVPGWRQTYAQDFGSSTSIGSWRDVSSCPSDAASNPSYPDLCLYGDGWAGTPNTGTYYPSRSVSTSNGLLDYYLHTETINGTATHIIDAAQLRITGSSEVGSGGGQLYGRYIVRARWDSMYGYHVSFLLWPDSNHWPQDGEIDWPETDMDQTSMSAFMHWQGATTGGSQDAYLTRGVNPSQWHDYEIDWTSSAVTFKLDGTTVGQSTDASKIPDTPMHCVLQTGLSTAETNLGQLGSGHLQVAWAVAYSPA